MRVLVACEFSGVVRRAFRDRGHDAWSCDLLPAEDGSPHHIRGDVRDLDLSGYDLLIAHPPCTHLAASGARWWAGRRAEQEEALAFVRWLWAAPVPRVAIENPIGALSRLWRPPDQIVQPHHFGHGETKATCLWLRHVPPLFATHLVPGRLARVHRMPPGPHRARERSRTYAGIAAAMASQWSAMHL